MKRQNIIDRLNKYKSELQQELNPKMDKIINKDRILLLKNIIKKLSYELQKGSD